MSTITLTYGDVCENHVGMQQIGKLASRGLPTDLLESVCNMYDGNAELVKLGGHVCPESDACVLIIRNGVEQLMPGSLDPLYCEQKRLDPDKKALMRGRVVNKRARYNLCFSGTAQAPDYEKGKGTIVAFNEVPYTKGLGQKLAQVFGTAPLECEGNYYFDSNSHIGLHGDTERRIVFGVRLGETMPLMYWWFRNFQPVGEPVVLNLNHGDIYVMSEKAVGIDWRRSSIMTLRHAAGTVTALKKERERILKKVSSTTPQVLVVPGSAIAAPTLHVPLDDEISET